MNLKMLLASALIFALPCAANGETGPWTDVAPGAKIRVLTSDHVADDGTMLAGLEFQLRDGMKTYWRIPGESGIPLTADWGESENLKSVEFRWPMPKRHVSGGYFDYVYDQDFVLPFEIVLSEQGEDASAQLAGDLLMGICGEICVPVTFDISQDLKLNDKDISVSFKLNAALADVPILDQRPNAPFEAVYVDETRNQIVVPPSTDPQENQSLILDLPNQNLLFDVPQNGPGSQLVNFRPLREISLVDHVGSTARLTYIGRAGAFEKMVPILSFDALNP